MLIPPLTHNEAQRLHALYRHGLLDTPAEPRFDRLTRLAQQLFAVPMVAISLVDEQRQWFKSRQGITVCETSRDISFCTHTILSADIFEVCDTQQDSRFADNPLVTAAPFIRFYAGAPLTTRDGLRIGTLCLIDTQPRQLGEQQRQALRDLADCVEAEIEKTDQAKSHSISKIINRAQALFIHEADQRKAFDELLNDILRLTHSEYGFIGEVLYNTHGDPYIRTYALTNIAWDKSSCAFYNKHAAKGLEFFNLHTLFGAALTTRLPVISNDPLHDPRRGGLPDGHPPLHGFLGLPILNNDELVAMVGIANRPGGYDQSVIDLMQPISATLGQLAKAAQLQRQHEQAQIEIARLSRIASQTTNAVIITDTMGQVEWINEGTTRMTGYTLAEMRGFKPGLLLQGEQSDAAMIEQMALAIRQQQPFEVDIINYTKQHTPFWAHISCNPLRDEQGKLQGFMSITSDISKQKANEEQIQTSHQTLDAILDNVPSMIFLKRASDLRFEYFNGAGEALLGRQRDELLGKNDYDFFPVEQADFFTEKDRQVLAQHQVVDIPEESIETARGTRLLHTRKLVLRDAQGKAQYLLGISEDITERTRSDRMKSEFVSIVSHELRTPLTSIAGSLGLLAGGVVGNLSAQAKQMIDIAYKNTNRLTFLINDLLDMEKLSAGKMHFEFRKQALLPMVEYAIRDNQTYANQRKVKFFLEDQSHDPWVNVDTHRFNQVLANLLSNAAKFSPEGETVTISVQQHGNIARVAIHDCGPGIPAEFHERIFQKFSQADSSDTRQKGGTGLGLAISRELIERMNGRINFVSEPGQGTTFYFELPICQKECSNSI